MKTMTYTLTYRSIVQNNRPISRRPLTKLKGMISVIQPNRTVCKGKREEVGISPTTKILPRSITSSPEGRVYTSATLSNLRTVMRTVEKRPPYWRAWKLNYRLRDRTPIKGSRFRVITPTRYCLLYRTFPQPPRIQSGCFRCETSPRPR